MKQAFSASISTQTSKTMNRNRPFFLLSCRSQAFCHSRSCAQHNAKFWGKLFFLKSVPLANDNKVFSVVSVSVYVFVYMFMYECLCTCVSMPVELKKQLQVKLLKRCPHFIETGFLKDLELTKQARLASQWVPRIQLSLPPQHWYNKLVPLCPAFYLGPED